MILGRICADAGRKLLDAVLPPLCLGCNEIVATPGALCASCWPSFSFIASPHCARCGTPFAEDLGEDALCGACLARACGNWMARAGVELLAEADLVAPVPLHWRRLVMRRYNQALLLARSVARQAPGKLAPDLLRRRR